MTNAVNQLLIFVVLFVLTTWSKKTTKNPNRFEKNLLSDDALKKPDYEGPRKGQCVDNCPRTNVISCQSWNLLFGEPRFFTKERMELLKAEIKAVKETNYYAEDKKLCRCDHGYTGPKCNKKCSSIPEYQNRSGSFCLFENDDVYFPKELGPMAQSQPCLSNPCQNGGTCYIKRRKAGKAYYKCKCRIKSGVDKHCNLLQRIHTGACDLDVCPLQAECKTVKQVVEKINFYHRLAGKRDYMYDPDFLHHQNLILFYSNIFQKKLIQAELCYCPGYTDANCLTACPDWKFGFLCMHTCSEGCERQCDKQDGECKPCKPDYTGRYCENKLLPKDKQCKTVSDCNRKGKCVTQNNYSECKCEPGFRPPYCEACRVGTHGAGCSRVCGNCLNKKTEVPICDPVDGKCVPSSSGPVCEEDYIDPFCKDREDAIVRGEFALVPRRHEAVKTLENIFSENTKQQQQPADSQSDAAGPSSRVKKFPLADLKAGIAQNINSVIQESMGKKYPKAKEAVATVDKLELSSFSVRLRRLLQAGGGTTSSLQVSFRVEFPQSLAKETDLQKGVSSTIKNNARKLAPKDIPGLAVDKNSISVSKVQLSSQTDEADESPNMNALYITGIALLTVLMILVSLCIAQRCNTRRKVQKQQAQKPVTLAKFSQL